MQTVLSRLHQLNVFLTFKYRLNVKRAVRQLRRLAFQLLAEESLVVHGR